MVYEAMKCVVKKSLEYKHAIYVKNLYGNLKKDGIGTTTVEGLSQKLCQTLPNHRSRTLVKIVIRWKLHDAYNELRRAQHENTVTWRREKKVIAESGTLNEFNELWRREITRYNRNLKDTGRRKLQFLQNKYKKQRKIIPDEIDGILLKDQELGDEYNSTPRQYGGVHLEQEEKNVLSLPTKFATHSKVTEEECQAQIEKTMAKLRWECTAREKETNGDELPRDDATWHNCETKEMDFRLMKATDLPFNKRISVPPPMNNATEISIQNLKTKLNTCTATYVENQHIGRISNLSEEERRGLASLKEKKKRKEIVIFETDKSKRFSCDTPENYVQLGRTHIENDEDIDVKRTKDLGNLINAHSGMWVRMLKAGDKTNSSSRISSSMASKNNPPAPLSILRKDHKQYESEVVGPPGRPVCGGDVSYNKRLSHLISIMLTDLYIHEKTVCLSTEGLLAEIERMNNEGVREDDIIGSADVEALYPSLDVQFTVDKVCELFLSSTIDIKGIDYKELSLYLSLNKTDEQLRDLGLLEYCPRRRSNRGPRPCMTGCGTAEQPEDRYRPWVFPDISELDEARKRRLVVEALRIVLLTILQSHTYEFAGILKRQRKGGPIGLELTGVVAQVFMVWWDRQFIERLNQINVKLKLHQRYVDDSNVGGKATPLGARYDGERLLINEITVAEDEQIPADERTMRLLQQVASYVHPSIRLTIDCPSRHVDGKCPMLDVKMWIALVNQERKIVYEHYEKEMTTKAVIHARSAISMQVKRTVLTQEVLRILLHCSEYVEWEAVCGHVNGFLKKMQYSGYTQPFRYNVVKSALDARKTIKEKEALGIRPINRPKEWRWKERQEEKQQKKRTWYKKGGFDSVLFVPSTPGGKLKSMYQSEISKSGIRIKVVEKTGMTLKEQLQVSNPFKPAQCGRRDCFVCTSGGKGNCNTEGVTYQINCLGECNEKNVYKGESADSGYTRGKEQATGLNARNEKSALWKHCRDIHNREIQEFQMNITGTFRNDPMLRQITEAVQIENEDPRKLMNTRAEWNMTRVPRAVIT